MVFPHEKLLRREFEKYAHNEFGTRTLLGECHAIPCHMYVCKCKCICSFQQIVSNVGCDLFTLFVFAPLYVCFDPMEPPMFIYFYGVRGWVGG